MKDFTPWVRREDHHSTNWAKALESCYHYTTPQLIRPLSKDTGLFTEPQPHASWNLIGHSLSVMVEGFHCVGLISGHSRQSPAGEHILVLLHKKHHEFQSKLWFCSNVEVIFLIYSTSAAHILITLSILTFQNKFIYMFTNWCLMT